VRLIIYSMPLLLSACAMSGTQIQAQCEARYASFVEIYGCTRDRLAAENPRKLEDPQAKLYMLRGEQLAGQVQAGKISDIDAKVAWAKEYNDLFVGHPDAAMQRAAAAAMIMQSQRQQTLDSGYQIVRPPTTTNCTTQGLFGTLQTNCTTR